MSREVVVVIGAGLLGQAVARRVASGRQVVLADLRQDNADRAAETFLDHGFEVRTASVDVASRDSVTALADLAADLGPVTHVIHAAGVSPSQASVQTILRVDLYGTALVLELFGERIAPGGSGLVIASQSGYRIPALTPEQDAALATTPTEELLGLPFLADIDDSLIAYQYSKRGNVLRVRGQAVAWGERLARVNALSPGIVITPLARDELTGPRGAGYRRMLELSPVGRPGTPDEIGELGAFVMDRAPYMSGTDILVDGGVTASWFYGPLRPTE